MGAGQCTFLEPDRACKDLSFWGLVTLISLRIKGSLCGSEVELELELNVIRSYILYSWSLRSYRHQASTAPVRRLIDARGMERIEDSAGTWVNRKVRA